MVEKLKEYGITEYEISLYYQIWWKLTRTENLEKKLNLLKWKPYAPSLLQDVVTLDKIKIEELRKMINLATKLEQDYWIKTESFDPSLLGLGIIERETKLGNELKKLEWKPYARIGAIQLLKNKLDLFKWKPYAPIEATDVLFVSRLEIEELSEMIDLATKLEQGYGIKVNTFDWDFHHYLSWRIIHDEDIIKKLDLLKWTPYAPKELDDVAQLKNRSITEIIGIIKKENLNNPFWYFISPF